MPTYMVRWHYLSDTPTEKLYHVEHGYAGANFADQIEADSHEQAFARWYRNSKSELRAWQTGCVKVHLYPTTVGVPITDIVEFPIAQPFALHIQAILEAEKRAARKATKRR